MIKISKEQQNEIQYEEKKTWKRRCMDYLSITAATAIYAVAVSLFMDPNSLAPGGITGIAIILNRITGLETGTWIFAVNIPILVLGMWKFGVRFILSTLYCTVLMSVFTNRLALLGPLSRDPLLAALVGGALMAVSLGGSLFGVSGMLFFIPLTSSCYALLKESVNRRNAGKRLLAMPKAEPQGQAKARKEKASREKSAGKKGRS